ncbi:MAG: phosphoenolpyruvate--protein phosphotransferase [Treponema sp.]|jgi:phosphotransferase system enzyme I (PtsI)|nr:phosphoenolpyruvate--protein phosphotransferase [Treponema sp.]
MKTITGIPASPGVAIGSAFLYVDNDVPEIPRYNMIRELAGSEILRLRAAINEAEEELRAILDRSKKEMSGEHTAIFEAHIMMLEDADFIRQLEKRISDELQNAEWVVWDMARELMGKMMASPDPVFRDRVVDINDVSKRVLYRLLSIKKISLADIKNDCILVAHDLLPSEVMMMNRGCVKAIVMDMGGGTSHTAILARAFNIPAALGLSTATTEIAGGDTIAVDGNSGEVTINPDKTVLSKYQKATVIYLKKRNEFLRMRDLPAETVDGRRFTLKANIEIPEEAESAADYGAQGIGLYRSEFLFLAPGKAAEEEVQFEAYRRVLTAMGDFPVTIRTVDIGGDKVLADFQATLEKNPLLGWRAIRFSLALPDLFKTQLRAILRASMYGNVRIMFPLISGFEELEQARLLLDEAREECRKKGQVFSDHIAVGTMIEVPSAAMIADILAGRSDFFSIGTNDLIQYSLAVDRGNERVNYLAQPVHPAVLRFLKKTIDAAHEKGIVAAMCGEMAGDPGVTAVLMGLGLDEFSMAAQSIPAVKKIIRKLNREDCGLLAGELLKGRSASENNETLQKWMAKRRLP